MNLLNQTRRAFVFENECGLKADISGIVFDEKEIRFPTEHPENRDAGKTLFRNQAECKEWLDDYFRGYEMKEATLTFLNVKQVGVDITDDEWEKMQKVIPRKGKFAREDFASFDTQLANNVMDRSRTRISLPVLKSFTKSIIGKSKLNNHNWYSDTGQGRFYDARLVKYTDVEEFIGTLGYIPRKDYKNHLKEILELDGGLYWFAPKFYMLNLTDKDQILRYEAGTSGPMSIGFSYPLLQDVVDKKTGNLKWREYQNTTEEEAEALEGSHVWLGDQYGSASKLFTGQIGDVETAVDVKGGIKMPVTIKLSFGEFKVVEDDPATVAELVKTVEKQVSDSTATIAAKDAEIERMKNEAAANVTKVTDAEAQKEAAETQLTSFKEAFVEDVVKMRFQSGDLTWDDAPAERKTLSEMTFDELKAKKVEAEKKFYEKYPEKNLITPATELPAEEKKDYSNYRPDSAYVW